MSDPLAELVARIDAYLARTGLHPTGFGLKVVNNGALVPRLRKGKAHIKTIQKVGRFLDKEDQKELRKKKPDA